MNMTWNKFYCGIQRKLKFLKNDDILLFRVMFHISDLLNIENIVREQDSWWTVILEFCFCRNWAWKLTILVFKIRFHTEKNCLLREIYNPAYFYSSFNTDFARKETLAFGNVIRLLPYGCMNQTWSLRDLLVRFINVCLHIEIFQ